MYQSLENLVSMSQSQKAYFAWDAPCEYIMIPRRQNSWLENFVVGIDSEERGPDCRQGFFHPTIV